MNRIEKFKIAIMNFTGALNIFNLSSQEIEELKKFCLERKLKVEVIQDSLRISYGNS